MANTIIWGPVQMFLPELVNRPGFEQPLWDFFNWTSLMGVVYTPEGSLMRSTPIRRYDYFPIDYIAMITRQLGDVQDYPAWVKRDRNQMVEEVPPYVSYSEYEDPDLGEVRQRTWAEYRTENTPPTSHDGFFYVPTNGMGQYILGHEIVQLSNNGYELLTETEMQDLLGEEAP